MFNRTCGTRSATPIIELHYNSIGAAGVRNHSNQAIVTPQPNARQSEKLRKYPRYAAQRLSERAGYQ